MATKKLRDPNNDIDKAENEINRRMAEGYKTGKHPAVPPKKTAKKTTTRK